MKRFTSIRHPIALDAGLGRLAIEPDYATHVEQLMVQVLLTNPGERINRPDFGCGLRRMIFAPNRETTASLAQLQVAQSLERWVGTAVSVEVVKVVAREETLEVTVEYVLKARQERRFLNVEVTP
jgi:phage baseplate assembly protein W